MELLGSENIQTIEGTVQTPNQRQRLFKNLTAALDYASWAQPLALSINNENGVWVMNYYGGNE